MKFDCTIWERGITIQKQSEHGDLRSTAFFSSQALY